MNKSIRKFSLILIFSLFIILLAGCTNKTKIDEAKANGKVIKVTYDANGGTGEMSDEQLRDMFERLTYLRNLEKRKEEVIRLIDEQGKLTEELKENIEKSETMTEVEDLYRPYKQKKRTRR